MSKDSAMLDTPKLSIAESFDIKKNVKLTDGKNVVLGVTKQISEIGATVELDRAIVLDRKISINFLEAESQLKGEIKNLDFSREKPTAIITFESISLPQYRQLIILLFCEPGRWTARKTPGELQSLWLFFKVLLNPLLPRKLKRLVNRIYYQTN